MRFFFSLLRVTHRLFIIWLFGIEYTTDQVAAVATPLDEGFMDTNPDHQHNVSDIPEYVAHSVVRLSF